MFQFPAPGFPIGGVADPLRPYRPLPPLGGRAEPKPPPPPEPETPSYPTITHWYRVSSFMMAVPLVITNKAKLLIDLSKEEELVLFMERLQVFAIRLNDETVPFTHFITHITKSGDVYFIYRRQYVDLEHPEIEGDLYRHIFEIVAIYNPTTEEATAIERYRDDSSYITRLAPSRFRLLELLEIEDGGSVLIYAPFTLLEFHAQDYFRRDSAGYVWREFTPDTPFTWQNSIYAPYLNYLTGGKYPVIADVYPSVVEYLYFYNGVSVAYENAGISHFSPLLFDGFVEVDTYQEYNNLAYERLYFYNYYKRFFPAEAAGRYTLNVGYITFDKPQAKLVLVIQARLSAPLRNVIKRAPYFHASEQIASTAKFAMSCNIQRKPSFTLQENLTAKAQVRLHINILPYFRIHQTVRRIPQFQLTEFVFRLYSSARFPLHINISGKAEGQIEQNIERKHIVPVFVRIQNRCYFPVSETTTRKPFFTLLQKHISLSRVRLIIKVKAPPPYFGLTLKVNSKCKKPLRIRCWRYERPVRNLAYYRYYGITIR